MRRTLAAVIATAALLTATGCSSGGSGSTEAVPQVTLRLGFVADVTQSTALIGIRQKIFAQNAGTAITLRTIAFRTDADEAAALEAGKLDAAYASTGTILSTVRAKGTGYLRIISGAATGGTELVVKPSIANPSALKGHAIAVPSADGPQAIALSYWLSQQHLAGPHQVTITPSTPGTSTVQDFKAGRIDGAWIPAPFDIEMVQSGGRVLATEASLWPGGQFGAINLVVRLSFLNAHTSAVLSLLKAQVRANDTLRLNPFLVATVVAAEIRAITGTAVPPGVVAASMVQLRFTDDPITATLPIEAQRATAAGLPPIADDLASLYDLAPLNLMLRLTGERPII